MIREKTDGNPFFVIEFLKTLQQDDLLSLDRARGQWTFRLDAIAASATTDNVVTLMTQRIQRLSPDAQHVLRLAACIGNPFKWGTFLTATNLDGERAEAGREEALSAGLIRPAEGQYEADPSRSSVHGVYAFIHDRVQQAAYALIPEEQRPAVHLDVGQQLLAESGSDVPEDRLFEIVNHLNEGRILVERDEERLALARLNLAAGRKAKASAAYTAALGYLDGWHRVLRRGVVDQRVHTSVRASFRTRRMLVSCGSVRRGRAGTSGICWSASLRQLDQAAVHELRVTFYENRSRYAEATSSGRDGLALFDLTLPDGDDAVDRALDGELDAIQRLLGGRSIASLVDLQRMDRTSRSGLRCAC